MQVLYLSAFAERGLSVPQLRLVICSHLQKPLLKSRNPESLRFLPQTPKSMAIWETETFPSSLPCSVAAAAMMAQSSGRTHFFTRLG